MFLLERERTTLSLRRSERRRQVSRISHAQEPLSVWLTNFLITWAWHDVKMFRTFRSLAYVAEAMKALRREASIIGQSPPCQFLGEPGREAQRRSNG